MCECLFFNRLPFFVLIENFSILLKDTAAVIVNCFFQATNHIGMTRHPGNHENGKEAISGRLLG